MPMSPEATQFNELLRRFAATTPGVSEAIVVSSDGLLLGTSRRRDHPGVEQFAAIAAGLTSMAAGASACFGYDRVEQLVIEMSGGFLFVMALGDGSVLGVRTVRDCDVGLIGYEMTMLLNRVGSQLTPALIAELKNSLVGAS